MTRCLFLLASIFLTTTTAWGAVALVGSNGRDWTVGEYTDDFTRKIQCLMRWDSDGRTFTYAMLRDGAVMSFRRNNWNLPEQMAETSVTLNGKSVPAQRLDDQTLGIGWGERPSPFPTLRFNDFIQSGQEMTIGFQSDEAPWVLSYPASVSISDGWLKCLAKLDQQ